jgi:hypothetical protein
LGKGESVMGEYEYDYDRVVDDSDDLLEDEDYTDDSYDYDYVNEREFDCYYHTLADELADE